MNAITLIGFSGVGKSFWSLQLERIGFKRICCDDLIERELIGELKGFSQTGIKTVADWMGQPYRAGYAQRQQRYLKAERTVMQKVIKKLSVQRQSLLVIDTTGSVIYTGSTICHALQRLSQVVYIEPSVRVQRQMLQRYLLDPKPVIWGDQFRHQRGQTDLQVIRACYPKLLHYRAQQYKKYAAIILPYESTSQLNFTIQDFLDAVL